MPGLQAVSRIRAASAKCTQPSYAFLAFTSSSATKIVWHLHTQLARKLCSCRRAARLCADKLASVLQGRLIFSISSAWNSTQSLTPNADVLVQASKMSCPWLSRSAGPCRLHGWRLGDALCRFTGCRYLSNGASASASYKSHFRPTAHFRTSMGHATCSPSNPFMQRSDPTNFPTLCPSPFAMHRTLLHAHDLICFQKMR